MVGPLPGLWRIFVLNVGNQGISKHFFSIAKPFFRSKYDMDDYAGMHRCPQSKNFFQRGQDDSLFYLQHCCGQLDHASFPVSCFMSSTLVSCPAGLIDDHHYYIDFSYTACWYFLTLALTLNSSWDSLELSWAPLSLFASYLVQKWVLLALQCHTCQYKNSATFCRFKSHHIHIAVTEGKVFQFACVGWKAFDL